MNDYTMAHVILLFECAEAINYINDICRCESYYRYRCGRCRKLTDTKGEKDSAWREHKKFFDSLGWLDWRQYSSPTFYTEVWGPFRAALQGRWGEELKEKIR